MSASGHDSQAWEVNLHDNQLWWPTFPWHVPVLPWHSLSFFPITLKFIIQLTIPWDLSLSTCFLSRYSAALACRKCSLWRERVSVISSVCTCRWSKVTSGWSWELRMMSVSFGALVRSEIIVIISRVIDINVRVGHWINAATEPLEPSSGSLLVSFVIRSIFLAFVLPFSLNYLLRSRLYGPRQACFTMAFFFTIQALFFPSCSSFMLLLSCPYSKSCPC